MGDPIGGPDSGDVIGFPTMLLLIMFMLFDIGLPMGPFGPMCWFPAMGLPIGPFGPIIDELEDIGLPMGPIGPPFIMPIMCGEPMGDPIPRGLLSGFPTNVMPMLFIGLDMGGPM